MASKPRPTHPNSSCNMLLLLLTCFILFLLPDSVYSLKSEYLSPAACRFRLECRQNASITRASSSSQPLSNPIAPWSSLYNVNSAFHGRIDNESCNNITITPPGFDGSCSVVEPCPNGACCGPLGFCGYSSDFCGDGCTSNCNAVAECGPDAAPGHEDCPLNVCCSKFGFCGTTDEFCSTNCVGDHCGSLSIPSGVNSPVISRIIRYYEGWVSGRPCEPWYPDNIPTAGYTHLNYAFASIDPVTFEVIPVSASDVPQYKAFTDLKQSNPDLKTYISVGGWAFNDLPTQHVFSDVASTPANHQAFTNSLVNFMVTYGFDGVDIDWEYPVACERGGVPEDTANMVAMFQTIRSTFSASGNTFGLTFTAPSSYWYLQHFDLLGLLTYANWVNLMSYDLHGVWDAKDVFIGNIVQAHMNLTEIEQSVGLFQHVGVPLDQIVLGLGFYGRSFQLSDPSCSTPGCPFNGPTPGGSCTAVDGTLSFAEIQDLLASISGASPVYDQAAQVKYLAYNIDLWVSYDDQDTFTAKVNWARGAGFVLLAPSVQWRCLRYLDKTLPLETESSSEVIPWSKDLNSKDGKQCVQPGCGQSCPSSYVQMTDITDGQLDLGGSLTSNTSPANSKSGCSNNAGNPVCCPVDQVPQNCQWRGTANICNGVCNVGEITLAVDSWGTGAKCSLGHKAFCCQSGLTADEIVRATDCQWYVCPIGTFTKGTDYRGDTSMFHACIMQEKSLCCRLPNGETTTSPFSVDDLFPNPPSNGDLSWDLQDDPINENAPNGGADANDNSFGLIAMDGPLNLLSSMAVESNWVLVGCTSQMDGVQTVTAYCRKKDSDPTSGCSSVFEDGAKNTLEVNNSIALASLHASKKPTENHVYAAKFDFDFGRMSETHAASDGSVLLRVDATTLPGYWSEIDTADPNSPIWRKLEERWFGAFGDWLSRLNKVKSNTKADLGMLKSFQSVLYSLPEMLTRMSNMAYIYVSSHGSATIGPELAGQAVASYNSDKVPIIPPIFWPGLSYPGIVSIGPSLNIYGQLQGLLAVSGTIGASMTYPFPEVHYAFRSTDTDTFELAYDIAPTFDVSLSGSLSIHTIPEASLVFNLLPNTFAHVSARAYVVLDGAITLSFAADTSAIDASIVASADVTMGIEATAGPSQYTLGPFNLFHTDITLYQHSIIGGTLTCPQTIDDSGSASCDQQLADDDPANADPDDTTDELFQRSGILGGLLEHHSLEKRVKVIGCTGLGSRHSTGSLCTGTHDFATLSDYQSTIIQGYWYFAQPTNPTDYSIIPLNQQQQGVSWAREHVYEVQLLTQFMSDVLLPQLFKSNTNTWCTWIKTNIFRSVQFPLANIKIQLSSLLGATEPTGNDMMPALIAEANSAKVTPNTINGRQAVEREWVDFFALNSNSVNGILIDVQQEYSTWLNNLLANYGENAAVFFNDAVNVLNNKLAANGGSVKVGVLKDCSSTKVLFDQNQLAALQNSVLALAHTGITWRYP
ncbi:hypothetical protein V8D89_004812 [Ganoderma adspersum]